MVLGSSTHTQHKEEEKEAAGGAAPRLGGRERERKRKEGRMWWCGCLAGFALLALPPLWPTMHVRAGGRDSGRERDKGQNDYEIQ